MTQQKKPGKVLYREGIERLVEEELEQALLEEGVVDWVKEKFSSAGAAVKQGWEKVSAQARQAIGAFQNQIAGLIKQAAAQANQLKPEVSAVQQALTQNGSNINALPGYKDVYNLLQTAPQFSKEMAQDVKATKQFVAQANQSQTQSNQRQAPATQQEAVFIKALGNETRFLKEVNEELELETVLKEADDLAGREKLNEGGVLGMALAAPTFLNFLLRGLAWVANKSKSKTAQSVASNLKKAAHWIHETEHTAIDKVVPDAAAYAYYRTKAGVKKKAGVAGRTLKATGGQVLSLEQFKANDKVRTTTKVQMYKIALIFFLVSGIQHVLHGIHNAFEGAEAAATAIKGIEVGTEAGEIAANLGSLAGAVGEGVDLAELGD